MTFIDLIKNLNLFDSHCHLNDSSFDIDRNEVVKRAEKNGIEGIIDIGINVRSSRKAIENSQKFDSVYAAVGIDAENLVPGSDLFDEKVFEMNDEKFDKWLVEQRKELEKLAREKRVLMIGETGMDNYWLEKSVEEGKITKGRQVKSFERQEKLFRMHCQLSNEVNKPLSIHSRNAIEKCLAILEEEKVPEQMAVFHSLTSDMGDDEVSFEAKVKEILDKEFFIGVNGIITFKNADLIRNVYKKFVGSSDWKDWHKAGFIFETDAPFLSPEPKRGERNEPGNIKLISLKL